MSLEDAIAANTKAIEANTAALTKLLTMGGAKAGAATDKPADKPADKKPATASKTTKAPTLEIVTEKVTAFLKTGDKETRETRKGQVGQIVEHYGVERFTAIPSESWTEALGYLKDFEDGNLPSFIDEGEGGDGDGEDESLV